MGTLSVIEAAGRLGVNHKVIRRLISQGHVAAALRAGRHGPEWRIDADSLESYRERAYGDDKPAGAGSTAATIGARNPAVPSTQMLEELREDKRFLREQVDRLTSILQNGEGRTCGPLAGPPAFDVRDVTSALQHAFRLAEPDAVASFEFAATQSVSGRPVFWRTAARNREDVAALRDALLSATAEWDPPAGACCFVFARNADGDVLWGACCGPRWFGPAFEEALRKARVERL